MQEPQEVIMENWKKQLIMDPTLNMILDNSQPEEHMVTHLISHKEPEEMSLIYSKLVSFKHSLTKHLKKEVQLLAPLIILNYHQTRELRFTLEQVPDKKHNLMEAKDFLGFYNQKYQHVETKTLQLKNCAKMLGFAKAYQKYIVQLKLLKALVANRGEDSSHCFKLSELIHDLEESCSQHNFSGLKSYESERKSIYELKTKLGQENDKALREAIDKKEESSTVECLRIAYNLSVLSGTLREYFNSNLTNVIRETKKILDSTQSLDVELPYFVGSVLKHSLDTLDLERIMHHNGFQKFFEKYPALKSLFGQFWRKVTETLEKLSTKFFAEVRNGQRAQRGQEVKLHYPLIFSKVVSIVNEVNLYVIQFPQSRLEYNFLELREQFVKGLNNFATEYHNYIRETSQVLLNDVAKSAPIDDEDSDRVLDSVGLKVGELVARVNDGELLVEIIEKICVPLIRKARELTSKRGDEGDRDQSRNYTEKLIEMLKSIILSSRLNFVVTLELLGEFQLPAAVSQRQD